MIKIDVSNFIPKRLWIYLLGIIPGLLFELSLVFGDPKLAQAMINRAKQVYPFQPYALLILFLVSSLVVGQIFFLLSWFADLLISFAYGLKKSLILATLGSNWLYRLFGRLQGIPPKRNFFIRSLSRLVMWGRKKRFPFEIRPTLKCQRLAATQLLKRKYGVNPNNGPWEWVDQEWQVWLSVLGKQPPVFREALLTMRTFLGCGIAELAALYISPTLRNRYFIAITSVLIASGCVQSLDFAKRRYDPMRGSLTRLVAVLAELAETNTTSSNELTSAGNESNLTIDPDDKEGG